MTWDAQYCKGAGEGRGHLFEEKGFATAEEGIQWAKNMESMGKWTPSVFDEKFKVDKEDFKQWGTDYFWFCASRPESTPIASTASMSTT